MNTVLNEISQWSVTLPYWEQATLEKIITGTVLVEADYDELLGYLLQDAELAPQAQLRPLLTFPQMAVVDAPAATKPLRLLKISNLSNVNALVPNQQLTFGSSMTVVFGANGSGKSGYARVIGSAAFTRGDKQVLMDITQPMDAEKKMTAEIHLTDGEKVYLLNYDVGSQCPEMGTFYVFDSTSVKAHLTKSNPMSFSPSGLAYLTQLADVTDRVRIRLQQEIDKRTQVNSFATLFVGETDVAHQIAGLSKDTNVESLRELAQFTLEEESQIGELDQQIAKLRSGEIPERIARVQQTIADLTKLSQSLKEVEVTLRDEVLVSILAQISNWHTRSVVAQSLSVEQFKTEFFQHTGSAIWHSFVSSALHLAKAESSSVLPYPQQDSRCLLCHQPLSYDARALINHLWEYLESDAQKQLADTEAALQSSLNALQKIDLDFFDDQAVSYRHLEVQDAIALSEAKAFLGACKSRRNSLLASIQKHVVFEIPPLPASPVEKVINLIETLRAEQKQLEDINPANEIADLEKRKLCLEHQRELNRLLPDIEKYIQDRVWISRASAPKTRRSTAHISKKYNELFTKLVTDRYLQLFTETLKQLKCPLKVNIATKAHKGETYKQLALETDATVTTDQASPDKVLSEGEQRAVALADFLTEVALDDKSTGVILDDPVTSLDFEWKEIVASHLSTEAKRRQVVVFTHDLHFLYCLKECSDAAGIKVDAHWIERRDGKPGWVFLNNSPVAEKDYKNTNKPNELHKKAKEPDVPAEERQRLLQEGFAALRTCYEAFVIFDLFGSVVLRFAERVSVDRLKDVAIDIGIRDTVVEKVGLLSRYIEGHLHSDQYVAQKPTPDMLLKEIEEFDALKKQHKLYKKSLGIDN